MLKLSLRDTVVWSRSIHGPLVSAIQSWIPGARSHTLAGSRRLNGGGGEDRQVVDRRLDRQLVVSDRC